MTTPIGLLHMQNGRAIVIAGRSFFHSDRSGASAVTLPSHTLLAA
ncbi:hypothetical protein PQR02_13625 [Paraburkholderia sediminicola]|uniref:Uncharacterized protein n=1 Tax=Paraburkholderia rhynchosiae TaxID=487049 RepID=A0ACC7NJ73_9BURK